ncbi:MAG: DUF721 domain-containing protein [Alphaproteobacteria bacterium]|nr:DUF721 domain-containing protein [Alphaproteobacteria bacterium]
MQPASRVASSLVSTAIRKQGFVQAEIVTRWAHIVGPELAESTVPVSLRFPRGSRIGATLRVRCPSAFAPLLTHRGARVIEMVNSFFGYQAVAKMEVQQGPLPPVRRRRPYEKKPLDEAQTDHLSSLVGDGELSPLQEAVKSLGEFVLSHARDEGSDDKK